MQNTTKYLVTITHDNSISPEYIGSYIKAAIKSWSGGFDPNSVEYYFAEDVKVQQTLLSKKRKA